MAKIVTVQSEEAHTKPVRAGSGHLKVTEPTACGRVEHARDASQVPPLCVGQSRREKLPKSSVKDSRRGAPVMVPVLSIQGEPLMPCHPARARELIREKGAKVRWYKGVHSIQLVHSNEGIKQPLVCGVDSGYYREAFTLQSQKHTYINVLSDAVTWVGERVTARAYSRKSRRGRKVPCRKCRSNRLNKKTWIAPSVKSRWQIKLRVINSLRKIYPISSYVVEDIKAINKKSCRNWNRMFSPLQTGKTWFYTEVRKLGDLLLKCGYDTFNQRKLLGLKKSKDKMSESFFSHNVDSWALASFLTGKKSLDMLIVFRMIPLKFHRRVLHSLSPAEGGKRKKFGGTLSLGFKRGSIVKHKEIGLSSIGGSTDGRVTLHNIATGENLTQRAYPGDCVFLFYNNWRTYFLDELGGFVGKTHIGVHINLNALFSNPEFHEKRKATNEVLYGNRNYTNREKARKTSMGRYGVEHTGSVPEIIKKRVATLKERYGRVFNVDRPWNKWDPEDLGEFKVTYFSGMSLSNMAVKYNTSEPTVTRLIKDLGLTRSPVKSLGYNIETPKEATSAYLKACLENGKVLSFYEYGKLRGSHNCTKMKRLFNAGKMYNKFLTELKEVALLPGQHDFFLSKLG